MGPLSIGYLLKAASLSALLCNSCVVGGQTYFATNPTRFLVCDKGVGSFTGKLPDSTPGSGVTVSVGAAKEGEFALRACQAKLIWGHLEIVVAPVAAQADIDVMGADLGLGPLVVAFQIKATDAEPLVKYEIYSLTKPPQLVRTITGEDFFSAADTRLDQSVEIWTTDATVMNGFENLPRSAFDSPPVVVLRFRKQEADRRKF
jgi:hypothetical protein